MPTYDGQRYIREALESLLGQDYPNLEIVVSDNCSTDDTVKVVESIAVTDRRIRLIRQPANIGAPANFNLLFRASDAEFFMWAADDDRWEPTYVSSCMRALTAMPTAVMACSRIGFLDEDGAVLDVDKALFDNPDLSASSVRLRVRDLISRGAWYQTYGLTRRGALVKTRLFANAYGADVVLLVELALQGPFALVPEELFHYRIFKGRAEPERGSWHGSIDNRDRVLVSPYSHMQEAIADAISIADLSVADRLRARVGMVTAMFIRPTPIRSWILGEAPARLRMAVSDRDLSRVIKYAVLTGLFFARRFRAAARSEMRKVKTRLMGSA